MNSTSTFCYSRAFFHIGGFLTVLVRILTTPCPAAAAPPVSWTPQSVSGTIAPGGIKAVSVSFHAFQHLGNVSIRVVPEIAPFVRVEPSSFANVKAGSTIQVSIIFTAAPNASLGMFDGTVQLKQRNKTLAKPLPVVVTVRQDPLIGTDANGDGIWDYVDDYIEQTYPNSEATRVVLRRVTVALQNALLMADNPATAANIATELHRAIECLYFVRPNDAHKVADALEAELLNTIERSRAYIHFNDQLGGLISPSTPLSALESACNS
jgi:hypothetical protein